MRLDGDRLRPFVDGPLVTRRQDKPRVFARNGPAVLAVAVRTLQAGSLYGEDCRPLLMEPRDSLDIDTSDDLELADLLLSRR
jgi:CMP-N-acetylneuraminic acid synthetase